MENNYVTEKLARFVQAYGPSAYEDDLDTLQGELAFFAQRYRLWIVPVEGCLGGLGTGIRIDQPEVIQERDWFNRESTTGIYFYVRLFVVHPMFREHGITKSMIWLIREQLLGIKYLVWHGESKLYIKNISRLLGERKGHNGRQNHSRSATVSA